MRIMLRSGSGRSETPSGEIRDIILEYLNSTQVTDMLLPQILTLLLILTPFFGRWIKLMYPNCVVDLLFGIDTSTSIFDTCNESDAASKYQSKERGTRFHLRRRSLDQDQHSSVFIVVMGWFSTVQHPRGHWTKETTFARFFCCTAPHSTVEQCSVLPL
jgi:hypothetical protein